VKKSVDMSYMDNLKSREQVLGKHGEFCKIRPDTAPMGRRNTMAGTAGVAAYVIPA
jgi:hypothetical protein